MAKPKRPKTPKALTVGARLRRYFFSGLATLFPIVVTLYLLIVVFQFVDGLLGRYINRILLKTYGYEIPGLGLLITLLVVLLVGMLSRYFFGQWMFRNFEEWFSRLPLVRRIYPSAKQLAQFLFAKEEERQAAFRRVVLVQYPRLGSYSVAFVTNETTTNATTGLPQTMLTLLIPNPPSPFTGPIIFVPKEEVILLKMSVEEAVRLIVSGGIVSPPLEAEKKLRSPQGQSR